MAVTREIVDAVVARLTAMFPGLAVQYFPDNANTYVMRHPAGALLVSYGGGKFSAPRDAQYVVQDREVKLFVNALVRRADTSSGVVEVLDLVRLALAGFRPPHCTRGLYVGDEHYLGQADGIWQYQTNFSTATHQVEDAEITGPLLTQINYVEEDA